MFSIVRIQKSDLLSYIFLFSNLLTSIYFSFRGIFKDAETNKNEVRL